MRRHARWLAFALACAVACVVQYVFDPEIHQSLQTQAAFVVAAGVLLALLAFWAFVGWIGERRRRREHFGSCARCGYSLRGNVSGVCPECGSAAEGGVLTACRGGPPGRCP